MLNGYDVIGDIHGCADKLEALLSRLGYEKSGGAWRHPDRMVIFLGDYIDRGPQILKTLTIVRNMREAGSAECLMGNHEFNAVCWNIPDPDSPGEYLRGHEDKHKVQHIDTLEQLGDEYLPWVQWMRSLPLWLELGDLGGDGNRLHMVHACWAQDAMCALLNNECGGESMLTGRNDAPRLTEAGYLRAGSNKNNCEYQAVEMLLKGPEIVLPQGITLVDKEGRKRDRMRVKWWQGTGATCRDMALMGCDDIPSIPEEARPAPGSWEALPVEYPTFFGHYWRSPGEDIRLYSPMVACLDFSAVSGGPLVAYRWNRGDTSLRDDRFVWIGRGEDTIALSRRLFFP
ncbi:metallophosphoesterase [Mailhella massiliensis]|uniref:Metallophosphoesterase n=1 Tax=Mailhella massiliensis TaxID=1903261 RepID=A0A921AXU2_9BACT|nr:metallophosphoesterase [Mailhella massiliensis]HJD98310.1 metallophosphoesterase [Mailhella massiliensis]